MSKHRDSTGTQINKYVKTYKINIGHRILDT